MRSAWVITRAGHYHATEVIGILSSRKSANSVRKNVEWLYALLYTPPQGHFDSASYTKILHTEKVTFHATNTGVKIFTIMFCGSDPVLVACRATDVELIDSNVDGPSLRWVTPCTIIYDPRSGDIIGKKPGVVRQAPINLPIRNSTTNE